LGKLKSDLDSDFCTPHELKQQFKAYDIVIKKEYFDQIVLDLYSISQDLSRLPFFAMEKKYLDFGISYQQDD